MPSLLAAVTAATGSALLLVRILGEQARKRRAKRFETRPELPVDEVWRAFSGKSGLSPEMGDETFDLAWWLRAESGMEHRDPCRLRPRSRRDPAPVSGARVTP